MRTLRPDSGISSLTRVEMRAIYVGGNVFYGQAEGVEVATEMAVV
jgi:hypothetical protein